MTKNAAVSGLSDQSRRAFLHRYEQFFFFTALFVAAMPGSAPLKLLAILALWLYLIVWGSYTVAAVLWLLSVALNLLTGISVGAIFQLVPLSNVFDHGLRVFSFFVTLGVGCYAAMHLPMTQKRLDQLIFQIAGGLMLFKLIIIVAILGGASLDGMQALFGFDTVTSPIAFGLQRLEFPSDIICPFLIACYQGGEKKSKDGLLLLCILGVIMLSFSRYLFAFYLLCTFVRALWMRKLDFITLLNVGMSVACVVVFFDSIIWRFASEEVSASDQTRLDQIHYLKIGIRNFPLLGTGIGSKAHDYLRSDKYPYFYEAQWYATTMQLGFIGVSWYVANLLSALCVSLQQNYILFSIVFLAWAASGFTNPFLTAPGSALGLSLLLLRCNSTQQQRPVAIT